jgi:serine/threonine protein phosphatase 1
MHDTLQFGGEVAADHRRIDTDPYENVYVVGDVHGCKRTLDRLLERLDVDENDLVVFVGDLTRKGPDSAGVVELVRSTPNFVSVRGNNEQKLVDGRKRDAGLTDDQIEYLADLPLAVSFDDALVVHGGVDPTHPFDEQDPDTLLTHRDGDASAWWWEDYEGGPRVFFGHTVHEAPVVREHAVGLDTGAVYGGELTAYDYRASEFVSVAPPVEHEHRPAEKFLVPGKA